MSRCGLSPRKESTAARYLYTILYTCILYCTLYLSVPVRLASLDLVRGELVTAVHLHGAVDDLVAGDGLQVSDLQHHNLLSYGVRRQ